MAHAGRRSGATVSPGVLTWVHRVTAGLLGLALLAFGVLGLAGGLPFLFLTGRSVFWLASNGLLSVVSLVAAGVLLTAAFLGPVASSTMTAGMGVVFLVSGVGHLAVLHTGWNLFGFDLRNVFFSLVAGLVLLSLGLYGRFSGGLPAENPYLSSGHAHRLNVGSTSAADPAAEEVEPDSDLERAEAAMAEGHETFEQRRKVIEDAARRAMVRHRRAWDRFQARRDAADRGRQPAP